MATVIPGTAQQLNTIILDATMSVKADTQIARHENGSYGTLMDDIDQVLKEHLDGEEAQEAESSV